MMLWARLSGDDYIKQLGQSLSQVSNARQLHQAIVNAPFSNKAYAGSLGLGIVVLLLADKAEGTINRIALSNTELAQGTIDVSVKPFEAIKVPLNYKDNYIAKAIKTGSYQVTSDWQYLFAPALHPEEARLNQAGGGIACSFIYPLKVGDGGALIFSYYKVLSQIEKEHKDFMFRYAKLADRELVSRLN